MSDSLENEIRDIVAEVLEIRPEEIRPEGEIAQLYELDSVAMLEILVTVERRYNLRIQEEEAQGITTFQKLVDLVRGKLPG
jgi:acyl carrier protein